MEDFEFAQEEEMDMAAQWCFPDEHDMIDIGDEDGQYFMCTKCGYQANAYVVNNYMSTPLEM